MNYAEAMEYMAELGKRGSVLGLHNMENLCCELENPERGLNIIHIAGTNGKGSVGAFIESALRAADYNVCRYVSPAVFEYEEILRYNGENMTRDEAVYYIEKVKRASDALERAGEERPTAFETETAMAFLYCRDKSCDYAIIETGMGGRLDATNVILSPRISVITSISMDHTAFLGGTIEEIAYEKAGIIKENGCVITAPQDNAVTDVLASVCREKNARLIETQLPHNIRGNKFDYDDMRDIEISLHGAFQPVNAATAIEVCTELGLSEAEIRCGLKNAVWRGRFETISENPRIIIDGAHNEAAAKMLARTIKTELAGKKINFIVGVLADKDYEKIAAATAHLADKICTVTPDSPRALDKDTLAEVMRKFNKNTQSASINDAVKKCTSDADSVTIAFGSLTYLKDIVKAVRDETLR